MDKTQRSREPEIIKALILIIETTILHQNRNINDTIRLLLELKESIE